MPRLPALDLRSNINQSPHVVILGAGASRAAFPNGDVNGRKLPVMADLVDCLALRPLIEAAGLSAQTDFETLYDQIATDKQYEALKQEIESRVRSYFEAMALPETPTIYDYLLLSLRPIDYVATFNWDPFLANAFIRNRSVGRLPNLLFLHGNVQIGICSSDRVKGFRSGACAKCGAALEPSRLLYPVRQKNYSSDPFIAAEWRTLESALHDAYMLTIFGYSAPVTDVEAVALMLRGWGDNPTFELAEVSMVDIKTQEELTKTWDRFLCRTHFSTTSDIWETWLFRHPRRSCDAFAMATLQNSPWHSNPFPKLNSLDKLHAWIAPLLAEEQTGKFTGNPCLQISDFTNAEAAPPKKVGVDWVLGWLGSMCRGEIIPPFCVEIVLTDGARYNLHSVLAFDDESQTFCARVWDLRAFDAGEIATLKQRINQVRTRSELAPAENLHPKLDWANLHVRYDKIAYCVEWHDRYWPEEGKASAVGSERQKR